MTAPRVFRFDGHRFDSETGDLTGPNGTTRLQPQPAKVFGLLLSRSGEMVSREELKQAVWPDTVVEADQGLNYCIRQIRSALGDDAEANRFLETLPRRGYRFLIPIEPAARPAAPVRDRGRRGWALTAVLVVGLAVTGLAFWVRSEPGSPTTVAVLPFATVEADSATTDLNRDLTERVVVALSADSSLAVIGPATTASLAGDPRSHPAIGRSLGAQFVVSGGLRLTDSTFFVQAIRTRDGVHVFAWRQPIPGRDRAEVAGTIARAALGRLTDRAGQAAP